MISSQVFALFNTVYTDVAAGVFGVLKQWNDSHVSVPKQSCESWIFLLQTLSFVSIDLHRSWTRIATITASYLGLKCRCKKFRNFSGLIRKAIFEQWAASERTQMDGTIWLMNFRVIFWEITLHSLPLKAIGLFSKKENLKIFFFCF